MATYPKDDLITAEEFAEMDFGDRKMELIDGIIYAMGGGSVSRARVQSNLMIALGSRLKGTGCRPFGSDMGVRTGDHSTLYPDVSVFCGKDSPDHDDEKFSSDPRIIFEVLSPSTKRRDQTDKLDKYRAIASVEAIVLIDADAETVRTYRRTGETAWQDEFFPRPDTVDLPSLDITLPAEEIFARWT
ncbi:MAG: Uma2 family endonuclease [Pacificimonas sp.]|jgi:Uma2 family endonuclease|nr:Uma2 family endonuclease [Pacificimonas sp.]